ncbi:MAG: hypothetical protein ACRC33_13195 [Gemmataceae bacterium]
MYHCKRRYADAVAYYRRAFEQGADPGDGLRFAAACAAALAAGEGGPAMRGQALIWLRRELDGWAGRLDDSEARRAAEAEMRLWQRHPNLAAARDPARLPEGERQAWQRLWADVRALADAARDG